MFIDLINNSHNSYRNSIIIVVIVDVDLRWVIAYSFVTVRYHVNGLA